jgi:uncharacterized protein
VRKLLFLLFFPCLLNAQVQTSSDSIKNEARNIYLQGLHYKNGNGVPMDYAKAFHLFGKAAKMGDAQAIYAVAYMSYKGLGCQQNYAKAAELFRQGADAGMDNSMYFLALCLRNGYGVTRDTASAMYWLRKADSLGSRQARLEMKTVAAENELSAAREFVSGIRNAAMPAETQANCFVRIRPHLPEKEVISGKYQGYILLYDWSGQSVIGTRKLTLDLTATKGKVYGTWREDGGDPVRLNGLFSGDSVLFENTEYKRTDHYSPDSAVKYNFKTAAFNIIQQGDSVFVAGNIGMFSYDRGEPSKPVLVAVGRKEKKIATLTTDIGLYPNPFNASTNLSFNLLKNGNVAISMVSREGMVVYEQPAKSLEAGTYKFTLQPGHLPAGTYLIRITISGQVTTVKAIHL